MTPLSHEGAKRAQTDIEKLGGLSRDAIKLLIMEHQNSEREHLEPRLYAIEEEARKIIQMVRDGFAKIDTRMTMQNIDQERRHEENIERGFARDAQMERLEQKTGELTGTIDEVKKHTINFKQKEKALDFLANLWSGIAAAKSVAQVLKLPIFWVIFTPIGGLISASIGQSWWYHHHPNSHIQIREITTHIPDAPPINNLPVPPIPSSPLQSFSGSVPSRDKIVGK